MKINPVSGPRFEALKALDTNGDKALSFDEIKALDRDQDHTLSETELQSLDPADRARVHAAFQQAADFQPQDVAFRLKPSFDGPQISERNSIAQARILARLPADAPLSEMDQRLLNRIMDQMGEVGTDFEDSLVQLAQDGRLSQKTLVEMTLLLDTKRTPMAPELDAKRAQLVSDAVREIAYPASIEQGHKNTCAGTTCQAYLATNSPEKYLTLLRLLSSPSGEAKVHQKRVMHRHDDALGQADGRSLSSQVLQPAIMDLGDDAPSFLSQVRGNHYDNATDEHKGGILPKALSQGLIQSEVDYVLESLMGKSNFTTVVVEQPNDGLSSLYAEAEHSDREPMNPQEAMTHLEAYLDHGYPVPVGMRWIQNNGKQNYHEVMLTRIDRQKQEVYFLNPQGELNTMPLQDFQQRVTAFSLPRHSELKALPGKGDALARMPGISKDSSQYQPLNWREYRSVEDQVKLDPTLSKLPQAQREKILDYLDDLDLEDEIEDLPESERSGQTGSKEVLDLFKQMVENKQLSPKILDELSQVDDFAEAQQLLKSLQALADSKVPREQIEGLLALHPTRTLKDKMAFVSPEDLSRMHQEMPDPHFDLSSPTFRELRYDSAKSGFTQMVYILQDLQEISDPEVRADLEDRLAMLRQRASGF